LHPSTPDVVVGVRTQQDSVGTECGEGRPQSLNSQSNTVQNTNQNTGDHFCGLTTMEGSPVTALPIVAVKVKVKDSPLCIETYALLDNDRQVLESIPPEDRAKEVKELNLECDASQCAYGAVSYLREVNSDGQAHCSFLVGKSHLTPLKQMSIPRLELAAATVSVCLNKLLKNELEIPIDKITFWTDSMTVLRYIVNESKRFHAYVTNRVVIIRGDSSPSQ